jgi:1-phosphofructokinase
MIYTVTLNPSLDYVLTFNSLAVGEVNRTTTSTLKAGGKGLNVSAALCKLRTENIALGFLGGFVGEEIKRQLKGTGITHDFTAISDNSRINIKLKHEVETDVNAEGPNVTVAEIEEFLGNLSGISTRDVVMLCGSVQKSLTDDFYAEIARVLPQGVCTVVDTSGTALKKALRTKPFLIKPNVHELDSLFGLTSTSKNQVLENALAALEMGAQNVLVSMGAEGAMFASKKQHFMVEAPPVNAVNTTGAGDTLLAGFMHEYLKHKDPYRALKFAVGFAAEFVAEKM